MGYKRSKTKRRTLNFQTLSKSLKGILQKNAKEMTDTILSGMPTLNKQNQKEQATQQDGWKSGSEVLPIKTPSD